MGSRQIAGEKQTIIKRSPAQTVLGILAKIHEQISNIEPWVNGIPNTASTCSLSKQTQIYMQQICAVF